MSLLAIEPEPAGGGIIGLLEETLEKARAGNLSSVAIAMVYRDGCTGDGWSDPPSIGTLIGAVAILQQKLIREIDT